MSTKLELGAAYTKVVVDKDERVMFYCSWCNRSHTIYGVGVYYTDKKANDICRDCMDKAVSGRAPYYKGIAIGGECFVCIECKGDFKLPAGEAYYQHKAMCGPVTCSICANKKSLDLGTSITEEAKTIVANRTSTYGDPIQSHTGIARLWNSYLNGASVFTHPSKGPMQAQLGPKDVALMMILLKVARLTETPNHQDSIIDIAGYAEVYRQIVGGKE